MIKHNLCKRATVLFFLSMASTATHTIDNPHFYRANFFWQEPRLKNDWLSTADILIGHGETKSARNFHGNKTPLLNIYGLHDMQFLGKNVPGLTYDNRYDALLIDLAQLPVRDDFGKLLFRGKFSITEGVINGYQNLVNGFFVQAYLPIRHLVLNNIHYSDMSPDDTIFPNRNTQLWMEFLENFSEILQRFNRIIKKVDRVGVGDFSTLVGWTTNYEDTEYLDYIDATTKIGVLFPTAKKRTITNPFDIPLGYDGFYGLPVKFDCSVGYWEWLTVGCHIGALFLFERKKMIPFKTSQEQNGFIMLASGEALVDSGTIWDIAGYIKADHCLKGLSLYMGYCYTRKEKDCIKLSDGDCADILIFADDRMHNGWDMHVIHWIAEYDFMKEYSSIGPRIGLFYNWIISGKKIFNTSTANALLGIDCTWCF